MNLLFINSFDCSPNASGGVNRVVFRMSSKLKSDYGVSCYLGFFEDTSARPLADFAGRIKLNRKFDDTAFEKFLTDNRIDIIHVNFLKKKNLPTIANIYTIAKRLNVKVVYAFHMCPGFQTVAYGSLEMVRFAFRRGSRILPELTNLLKTRFSSILLPLERLILRNSYRVPYLNCDKIVVLSREYIEPYMKLAGINDSSKFSNIGNPLSFNEFLPADRMSAKKKQVLVVARFDEDTKRLSIVLKAWQIIEQDKNLGDWQLVMVGDGRDMDFYRYLVGKYRLARVIFTGQQQPQPYYADASIFLMTSSAEGWPMALSEATQMGCTPIVLDTFGSLHDLVQNGVNGIIIKNDTSGQLLAEAIAELIANNRHRETLGLESIELSHRFELDNIAAHWMRLYREITLGQHS